MHPFINLFSLEISVYGLISILGVFAAGFAAYPLTKRAGVDFYDFLSTALVAGLGLFLGAHLLYALTRIEDIIYLFGSVGEYSSFWEFSKRLLQLFSGMVFYGGLYGGLLFGYIWVKKKKLPLYQLADIFAVVIPLFHAFGRVGCFFAGCCYGVEWEHGISGRVMSSGGTEHIKRLPVQLIESGMLLILFAVLMMLFLRGKAKGKLMCVYLTAYAVMRFVLEFFRGDEIRGRFLLFSTSQWISLLTIAGVCIYLTLSKKKIKTE